VNVMLLSAAHLALRALSVAHRTVTVWHVKHVINHSSLIIIKIQPHTHTVTHPPPVPSKQQRCRPLLQNVSKVKRVKS
jgi:hypothetical protein